ncbi:peptidylprolyl isomerase [candidate division KSB1 bacterium]
MAQAQKGDTVKVHYTGTLEDGTVFDSSKDRDPFEFSLGENQVIPGFEEAVIGLKPGDTTSASISPEKAYGLHRKEMITVVEKSQFPKDIDPTAGQQLQLQREDNQTLVVTVTDVTETEVTLDANHPLAGKHLKFEIELVEIV